MSVWGQRGRGLHDELEVRVPVVDVAGSTEREVGRRPEERRHDHVVHE
jgi:hypothetical protein